MMSLAPQPRKREPDPTRGLYWWSTSLETIATTLDEAMSARMA
jgi:hypothetical protein